MKKAGSGNPDPAFFLPVARLGLPPICLLTQTFSVCRLPWATAHLSADADVFGLSPGLGYRPSVCCRRRLLYFNHQFLQSPLISPYFSQILTFNISSAILTCNFNISLAPPLHLPCTFFARSLHAFCIFSINLHRPFLTFNVSHLNLLSLWQKVICYKVWLAVL